MTEFAPSPSEEPHVEIRMGRNPAPEVNGPELRINMGRHGNVITAISGGEIVPVTDEVDSTQSLISINMGRRAAGEETVSVGEAVSTKIGEVEFNSPDQPTEFAPGLRSFMGAEVTGLKHLARTKIDAFDPRTYKRTGTFGSGLYLGANHPIAKTDLETIQSGEHYEHDIKLKGNILAIDIARGDIDILGAKLPSEAFNDYLEFGGFGGASLLMEHPIDGVMYDAIVFHAMTELADGPIVQTEAIVRDPSQSATVVSAAHKA